jgi:hypothetical protein
MCEYCVVGWHNLLNCELYTAYDGQLAFVMSPYEGCIATTCGQTFPFQLAVMQPLQDLLNVDAGPLNAEYRQFTRPLNGI